MAIDIMASAIKLNRLYGDYNVAYTERVRYEEARGRIGVTLRKKEETAWRKYNNFVNYLKSHHAYSDVEKLL